MTELHPDEPLDEGYWESLGVEDSQARPRDPFSGPPPGHDEDPFSGHDGPTGRSKYEAPWQKTRKGIEFIDVFVGSSPDSDDTHMLIFLYEVMPGRWNVGLSRPRTTMGGSFLHEDRTYAEARLLAEDEAGAMSVDAGLNADWRRDPPSDGQLNYAARLRIKDLDTMQTKGQVSDAINQTTASRILDPTFARS